VKLSLSVGAVPKSYIRIELGPRRWASRSRSLPASARRRRTDGNVRKSSVESTPRHRTVVLVKRERASRSATTVRAGQGHCRSNDRLQTQGRLEWESLDGG